jgi:hypothetical protein
MDLAVGDMKIEPNKDKVRRAKEMALRGSTRATISEDANVTLI